MNKDLLSRVMEHIEIEPRWHDQGVWAEQTACGTYYCFAGHTVLLAGWQIRWPIPVEENCRVTTSLCYKPNGESDTIANAAQQELGLTEDQANVLFTSCDSIDNLRDVVNCLLANEDSSADQLLDAMVVEDPDV